MPKIDAFKLLTEDHKQFRKMFKDYEALGDRAIKSKQQLAAEIFDALAVHETIEEEILYPAIREHASKNGVEMVLEGYEEHHVADLLIEELRALAPEDEPFDPKMKVLIENVEHHIDEEETDLFPEARKALGDMVNEIGEQMQARKEALTGQPVAP